MQNDMIKNVKMIPLKQVLNSRGRLLEIQRYDEEWYPGFGQVYVTTTFPGIIKAWYRHQKQIDQLIPIQGVMKLVLYDPHPCLSKSFTLKEFIIKKDNPTLIQIPPGLWHGFQALSSENLVIVHLNNRPFQSDCPDEERLTFDDNRVPYRW